MSERPCVAFLWSGLPDYGARLIRAFIGRKTAHVEVIATKPSVPIAGMERSVGQRVHWVDGTSSVSWRKLGLSIPDFIFQGGWAEPEFVALSAEARRQGAKIFLMNDQNWRGNFRQRFVEPLRFMRRRYNGVLVPGSSGARYAKAIGFKPDQIAIGLYGADPDLFHGGLPLLRRKKEFLFVGQLIARKNIIALVKAFQTISDEFPDWSLRICGGGELQAELPRDPRIKIVGFVQPRELSDMLREARCLVLPSHEEHWGLVVHEAVSCGCALVLSDAIGSADDLADDKNAHQFSSRDIGSLENALRLVAGWSDEQWLQAELTSRQMARKFGPQVFANAAQLLIDRNTA